MLNASGETRDHSVVTRYLLPLVVFFLIVAVGAIGASLTHTVANVAHEIPSAHNELR